MNKKSKKVLACLSTLPILGGVGYGIYLSVENNNLKQQVASNSGMLQTIKDLQNNIKQITLAKEELQREITFTKLQLETMRELYGSECDKNDEYKNQIKQLEQVIEDANVKLRYYEDLINGSSFEGYKQTFYSDNEIYFICYAKEDTKLDELVATPIKKGFEFQGWSLREDSDEIVDLSTHTPTAGTNFYAVWKDVRSWEKVSNFNDTYYGSGGTTEFTASLNVEHEGVEYPSLNGATKVGITNINVSEYSSSYIDSSTYLGNVYSHGGVELVLLNDTYTLTFNFDNLNFNINISASFKTGNSTRYECKCIFTITDENGLPVNNRFFYVSFNFEGIYYQK